MPLRDEIAAIHADSTIGRRTKQKKLYSTKVGALHPRLQAVVGRKLDVDGVTYDVLSVTPKTIKGVDMLVVAVVRTADGRTFDPIDELRIVNPPIVHGGKAIDEMTPAEIVEYTKALLAAMGREG